MAAATVSTNSAKRTFADRMRTTPVRAAQKFIAIGVGAGARTAAITDAALTTEVESRVSGTESLVTTAVTEDTYQTVGTITATAARAVDEVATFDAATVGNIGVSATVAPINLASGDSLQLTIRSQMAP